MISGFKTGRRLACRLLGLCLLLSVMPVVIHAQAITPRYAAILPKAPQSLLLDIVQTGERLVAVGERGHILFSEDGGQKWQQAKVPTTQMLTAVFFISPRKGWATGHDGLILFSEDGGSSWRLQRNGLAAQQQINLETRERTHRRVQILGERVAELEQALANADDPAAEAELEQLSMDWEDAQMDLEDAELTLSEPITAPPLMDIWFADEENGWAVGAFGTLVATRDGGQSWQYQRGVIDNEFGYHYNGITGDDKGRLIIAGEAGGLYRSLDGGESWQTLQSPYDGSWFGVLHSASPDYLVIFGLRGNIYRSADFGDSWEMAQNANTMNLGGGTIAADGQVVLVGSVGAVLHSEDQAASFEAQMQPDRLSLSGVVSSGTGNYIVVGQGGVRALILE